MNNKCFKYRNTNYRELSRRDNIIAAECIEDNELINGMVDFFFVSISNGQISLKERISYSVTRERFFEILSTGKTSDVKELDKILWNHFYRIPQILRELIIDAYLDCNQLI